MISILTLVKNREDHLRRLIEGLERSAVLPAELIIVDMSDVAIIPPSVSFPLKLHRLEGAGLPLAAARNLAASQADSEHLLFLDVDCIPSRELVACMDEALARHDGLICTEVLYLGPGDVGAGDWLESALVASGKRHPVRRFPQSGIVTEANAGLFWSLAFGVRRSTFFQLGGFDEAFQGYGAEDTDFGFAAQAAGLELLFMGGAPAFHQHHGVTKPPLQHFADIVRNATVFRRKWGRWPMEGWLREFRQMGLIEWSLTELNVIQSPSSAQIAVATDESAAF
jgi:GT2 family glycosyltransferase